MKGERPIHIKTEREREGRETYTYKEGGREGRETFG